MNGYVDSYLKYGVDLQQMADLIIKIPYQEPVQATETIKNFFKAPLLQKNLINSESYDYYLRAHEEVFRSPGSYEK